MTSLILTLVACLGVPKTTFRFSDLLEGLTEYAESLVMVIVYYSKRIQIKISPGKRYNGTKSRIPNMELPVVLS